MEEGDKSLEMFILKIEILVKHQRNERSKSRCVWRNYTRNIVYTKRDENSDLGTTYLGEIDLNRLDKMKAEEKFLTSVKGYTIGNLSDGTEYHIL